MLRFRPVVRLSPQELPDHRQRLRGRRPTPSSRRHADPAAFALPLLLTAYAMATASTLCGALLAENGPDLPGSAAASSASSGQRFYIAIMAVLVRQAVRWSRPCPPLGALQVAAAIAAVAPIAVVLASLFLLDEKKVGASELEARAPFQSLVAASTSARLYLVALFLFLYAFAPGFGTPLYYFMTDELKFSQSYIGILGAIASAGWICRRPGPSLPAARHELEGAAHSQHRSGHAVGRLVPAAGRPCHRGDRELRQRRCHDDRHHRLADARRRLLSQARRRLRLRRADVDHESSRSSAPAPSAPGSTTTCSMDGSGPLIIVSAASTRVRAGAGSPAAPRRPRQSLAFDSSRYWLPNLS